MPGHFGSRSGTASHPDYTVPIFPFTGASYKDPFSHALLLVCVFFPFCLPGGGCLSVAKACMQGRSAKSPCPQPVKRGRTSALWTVFMNLQQNTGKHVRNSSSCFEEPRASHLVVNWGGLPCLVFDMKTQHARASQVWRGIKTHMALKTNRREWLWARAEEWLWSICRVEREAGALHGHRPSLLQKPSSRDAPVGQRCPAEADLRSGNAKARPRYLPSQGV